MSFYSLKAADFDESISMKQSDLSQQMEDINGAVAGLQSLLGNFPGTPSSEEQPAKDSSGHHEDDDSSMYDCSETSSESVTSSREDPKDHKHFPDIPASDLVHDRKQKKKIIIGETEFFVPVESRDDSVYRNVFIASSSTKFSVGSSLNLFRSFSTAGKVIFFNDSRKRCYRMEFLHSVSKSIETSRLLTRAEVVDTEDDEDDLDADV